MFVRCNTVTVDAINCEINNSFNEALKLSLADLFLIESDLLDLYSEFIEIYK